ncbi:MAG: hypothetical protein JEZ05_02125 [Tenericutes bacterium]|nr:hypothetical protein [Mycoplasmatota bacterium]
MTTYKYKKHIVIVQYIFVGTVIPVIALLSTLRLFSIERLNQNVIITLFIVWLLFNFGLVVTLLHKLIVSHDALCNKLIIGSNTIKWREVNSIKFRAFRKRITIQQDDKKRIVICSDYNDFEKLCIQIWELLKDFGKE